jgi:ATP-dependent helicase/nuclease subunit A
VRRPSDAVAAASPHGAAERRDALVVGTHVHRLLERLPPVVASERERLLDRALAASPELDEALRARVRGQVLTTLARPELAPLFGPEAWVEQPVVGEVDGERVAGTVDRMAVVDGELWLADFKTGRPPAPGEPMPEAYARQLAAYARVLQPLFSDCAIRPRLIWTATGAVQLLGEAFPGWREGGGVD